MAKKTKQAAGHRLQATAASDTTAEIPSAEVATGNAAPLKFKYTYAECRMRCEGVNKHEERTMFGHHIVFTAIFKRTDHRKLFAHEEVIELSFYDEGLFEVGREYSLAISER